MLYLQFFKKYNVLIQSDNYVTKRQSLKVRMCVYVSVYVSVCVCMLDLLLNDGWSFVLL